MSLQNLLVRRPIILQLLRFVAIGVLNTALDFIILNFISKTLGITSGLQLGTINIVGFVAAMVQSYFWNRYWAFSASESADIMKNFVRLMVVGGIGALGFVAVVAGAKISAAPIFYLIILVIFLVAEIIAWMAFGLSRQQTSGQQGQTMLAFVIVSVVGLLINSLLVGFLSGYLVAAGTLAANPDLVKNVAKLLATAVSLIWNFIGYKLVVFRK